MAALRQLRARKTFDAAWSLFDNRTRSLLAVIVIANMSVTRYAAAAGRSVAGSKDVLIEALHKLAVHFDIAPRRRAA